jgi:hypothetical protein
MAAPYDFNNIQPGTVLERIGHMEQGFSAPYWIVHTIIRDDADNIAEIHLRMYDTNNHISNGLGIGKTLAQLPVEFTFVRQDPPLAGVLGGRRRRSRRVRRRRVKRSRRVKRTRRY